MNETLTEREIEDAWEESEFLYVVNYLRDLKKNNKLMIYNRTGKSLMDTIDVLELDTGILAIAIKEPEKDVD